MNNVIKDFGSFVEIEKDRLSGFSFKENEVKEEKGRHVVICETISQYRLYLNNIGLRPDEARDDIVLFYSEPRGREKIMGVSLNKITLLKGFNDKAVEAFSHELFLECLARFNGNQNNIKLLFV